MNSTQLSDGAAEWFAALEQFLETHRERAPLPSADDLDAVQDEQRRVMGGSLMQFLQFLQNEAVFEAFPILNEEPIAERVFVFATDAAGVAAARDLIDPESDRAAVVTKEEWHAWLEAPGTDPDETYDYHYQYWSIWHQNVRANWRLDDVEMTEELDYWVHEEGFALADRAGRGAEHLWSWDGSELELVEQSADRWTSRAGGAS